MEKNQTKYLAEIKNIVAKNIPEPNFKVFLFGSRATMTARKFSDFDIGILGRRPLLMREIRQIKDALEDSNIPYKVDVVDFYSASANFKNIALSKTVALL